MHCSPNYYDLSVDAIDELQFIKIIQDYVREHPSKIQINDVIAADTMVTQLMQMAHIKDTVMGNCVIITKVMNHIKYTVVGSVFLFKVNQSHKRHCNRNCVVITKKINHIKDTVSGTVLL